jgi:CubicO group peptidase (beta-lactamase class C family)
MARRGRYRIGIHGLIVLAAAALAVPAVAAEQTLPHGNILFWPPEQRPAGFMNMEKIYPTDIVKAGGKVHPLPKAPQELAVTYTVDGKAMDTDRFMAANNVAGLMIIKDGTVLLERYRLGFGPEKRWTSFSTAKSITSTLVGAAIRDGYIKSIDDPVSTYITRLKGSTYDSVSIRNMLKMSSGVRWNEDYEDPNSDAAKLKSIDEDPNEDIVSYMAKLPRESAPGEKFLYRTGDSNLLGVLVAEATHRPLAQYLSEKIWVPYGMEADAAWVLTDGVAMGGSGLSMRLHDFARFGLFFLGGGMVDGKPVLPEGWTKEATGYLLPTGWGDTGYGYQWWTERDGTYRALGIFGQLIYTDPAKQLIVVAVSAWPHADADQSYVIENAYLKAVEKAVTK